MNSMEQLEENLQSAETLSPAPLSAKDMDLIESVRAAFKKRAVVPCTKCGYCLPCPGGVDIPGVIELYNNGIIFNDMAASQFIYNRFFQEGERAGACVQCGQCEEKCPQGIGIKKLMPVIDAKLK
jgi:predicted aldo/keto reductase-like oxidoreductase